MKIFKKILVTLGVLLLLFVIVGLFLDKNAKVEESIIINAPEAVIFEQVNNFRNWEAWSPWHELDPGEKVSFAGPEKGVGASMHWDSEHEDVGVGTQIITESVPYSHIMSKITFDGMDGFVMAGWKFEKVTGGVKVTWNLDCNADIPVVGGYIARMIESKMCERYKRGLERLKAVCEKMPKDPLADMKIEVTTVDSNFLLAIADSSVMDTKLIGEKFGKAYGEIQAYMQKHKISMTGAPLSVTDSWSKEAYKFHAAIPVNVSSAKPEGRIKGMSSYGGKVVKAVYIGPYDGAEPAYMKIMEYMKANGLQENGKSWEEYISDPSNTPQDKLITNIYFPAK